MKSDLNVEIIGNGEPLILLHGWGWHSGVWQPLVPVLSQYYQLFLIDLPGFGKSPLTISDYSLENIAPLVFAAVPEKASWLGWSMGGLLAWWVALRHPQKVKKLITVASSPCFLQKNDWPGIAPATLEKFSTSLTQDYERTVIDFLDLQLRGSPKNEELFLRLKQEIFSVKKPPLAALVGGLQLLATMDLRAEISQLQCPSLHIFGSLDMLVPAKIQEFIQSQLPTAECHVIPHTGHMPFISQQETFVKLMGY